MKCPNNCRCYEKHSLNGIPFKKSNDYISIEMLMTHRMSFTYEMMNEKKKNKNKHLEKKLLMYKYTLEI